MKMNATSTRKTRFESIGTYLPEKVVSTTELMSKGEADFSIENVVFIFI